MFFPLVLVARESVWTQEQADEILGAVVLGWKIKWGIFGVSLGMGVICTGLTAMHIVRRRKLKRSKLLAEEVPDY